MKNKNNKTPLKIIYKKIIMEEPQNLDNNQKVELIKLLTKGKMSKKVEEELLKAFQKGNFNGDTFSGTDSNEESNINDDN